jgi:multidrug efflux pump
LSLDQQLFADNFAQFVIVSKGLKEREEIKHRLEARFAAPDYSHLRVRVVRLENGPPIGYPVQFRVMGEDLTRLREISDQVAAMMRANAHLQNVNFDWNEKIKSVRVMVNQDRARQLGTSSQEISQALQGWLNGVALTQYREGDQLIDVVWRGKTGDARSLDRLPDLDIPLAGGRHVPLAQVAKLVPVLEEGMIWRRNRLPTMTVRADMADATQPATVSTQLDAQLEAVRARLPAGYRIEMGGSIEESAKGQTAIMKVMPLMLVGVITLLMIQLQSISRTVIVLLTAPLGLIGVTLALLVFGAVRLRRQSRLHRAGGDDHAQRGDTGRPDPPGRGRRQDPLASHHRLHRAALPPHHVDRCGGHSGDDPADPPGVLGADGGFHHGRAGRRHIAHMLVPAGAVCGVVQGERGLRENLTPSLALSLCSPPCQEEN